MKYFSIIFLSLKFSRSLKVPFNLDVHVDISQILARIYYIREHRINYITKIDIKPIWRRKRERKRNHLEELSLLSNISALNDSQLPAN